MTPSQSARLVAAISAAFPGRTITKETVSVYASLMTDLDYDLAEQAVRDCLMTSKFPPTVAEIREAYGFVRTRTRRARALPEQSGAEVAPEEREANLRQIREYASKIGIGGAA